MADSWNDRLETLQKTLDDIIKSFSERLKRVEDRPSQQWANEFGENSTITKPISLKNSITPSPKPDPITSPEATPPNINPSNHKHPKNRSNHGINKLLTKTTSHQS